jgi:hypothetical protein
MSTTDDDDFQPPMPAPGEAPPATEPLGPGEQTQRQPPRPDDPTSTPADPEAPGEGTDQPRPQPTSPQRGL